MNFVIEKVSYGRKLKVEDFDEVHNSDFAKKYVDSKLGCEFRSSGSFRWIRLVKLVSKKSISAFVHDIFGPKIEFLIKKLENQPNSSLLSPLGGFYIGKFARTTHPQ